MAEVSKKDSNGITNGGVLLCCIVFMIFIGIGSYVMGNKIGIESEKARVEKNASEKAAIEQNLKEADRRLRLIKERCRNEAMTARLNACTPLEDMQKSLLDSQKKMVMIKLKAQLSEHTRHLFFLDTLRIGMSVERVTKSLGNPVHSSIKTKNGKVISLCYWDEQQEIRFANKIVTDYYYKGPNDNRHN